MGMAHCQIERAEIGPCQDSRGNCRVLAGARVERAASRPHGQQPRGAERRNETGPDPAAVSPPRTGAVRNVSASRAVTARPASPGGVEYQLCPLLRCSSPADQTKRRRLLSESSPGSCEYRRRRVPAAAPRRDPAAARHGDSESQLRRLQQRRVPARAPRPGAERIPNPFCVQVD